MELQETLMITRRCQHCGRIDPGPEKCPKCRGLGRALEWSWRKRWHDGTPRRAWRVVRDGLTIDRQTGRRARRFQELDWQADTYRELITDFETGAVIHEHCC